MSVNPVSSGPNNLQDRCKSVMNILRRALSFRNKHQPPSQENRQASSDGVEMQPVAKPRIDSLPNSDVASTSASCSQPRAPSVYEDPFVAVTANGTIFIKHYYSFQNKAEFRLEDIRYGHVKRNSRVIKVKDVVKVYYAAGQSCKDETVCKSWGICMNEVWWASHLNRMEGANTFTNVVLIDDSVIFAGFSVVNIDAFAESIQCVGLSKDAPFQNGLPNPPLSMLQIPYIDEDETEAPKKRRPRRHPSKAGKSKTTTNQNTDDITPI